MGHSLLCMTGLLLLGSLFYVNAEVPNKPTVILEPSWPQIYSSETVTVRCEGSQSLFVWREATLIRPRTSEYRISRATESDSGGYSCCTMTLSVCSDIITLTVSSSKPRATLTAQASVIPAGGSVTLSCSVEGSAGWKFDWFRRDSQFSGGQKIGAGTSEHTISISEGGIYYCRGGRGDPVFSTEDSAAVTIQKQVLAAVKLQHSWSQIFTGETITLRCEIQGGEGKVWKYEWTAPNTNSPPTSSEYRISRVSVSHSGDYRCRGSSDYLLTGWSDAFTLTVSSSKPRATLTTQSSVIPAGGSVTLSCSVEGSAGWKFDWFRRDSVSSKAQLMRGNEANRVISVSQGGLYHCRGGRGDPVYYTEDSSDVTVVETSSKPRATLREQSPVIPAGGSVTLSCSVEGSAGWKFDWFRRDSQFSGGQKIGAGTSEHTISISEGGIYYCRGGRGDPVFSTEDSAAVTIQKQVLAAVKLQHSWSQIFSGETITLRCEIQGGEGKVWKYEWTAPNTNSPPTSSEYRISRVSVSHSGYYRCRGSSDYLLTGWSDAFRLTVSSDKPRATLTAGTTIIPVGGSVTLNCSVNPSSSSGWKYYWYRDNTTVDVVSPSNGQISVSQEGLYRCRGGRGNPVYYTEDSQEVQINKTVTVSGADISSSPVWLMVGLVCGVSLIIILLLLLYRCRQSKYSCFTRSIQSESHSPGSSTNHGVNQNETHEYNSLHPGDANLYESITQEEDTGTADVTYSLITLQNFGKKRKHHKAEQSAVYSEVKTGAAEDSLMYAEVKQPKKEKAKKNKGTSSPAADAAVYSEVTSGSSLSQ
ncbi:basement membrane-specific heparan sulfate proteoglycan core protein-like [Simochromis diagramma]|uniref:basement membrane-specific heparan sulfate proteoglycan core protein-like n=1 Tax=Simochromis diagramma TaxID=43689 RepID=UPI001A7F0DAF|nr:basement membrane-specific heparan sulfate proteoglycan core protein-like [Simochromis diagramma]